METFVYGLFPNQQRKINIKNKHHLRKSLDSIHTEELPLKNSNFLT